MLKIHPDDPDAHIKMGDIYFHRGDNKKALDSYNMAMEVEVDESPFIYEKRARVLKKLAGVDWRPLVAQANSLNNDEAKWLRNELQREQQLQVLAKWASINFRGEVPSQLRSEPPEDK